MQKDRASAVLLIGLGLLVLGYNLDIINTNIFRLVTIWWPVIPIAVGISMLLPDKRERQTEKL